jgi:DNA-binding transcriptional regulator YiaG
MQQKKLLQIILLQRQPFIITLMANNQIASIRNRLGISQKDAANLLLTSRSQIGLFESNRRRMNSDSSLIYYKVIGVLAGIPKIQPTPPTAPPHRKVLEKELFLVGRALELRQKEYDEKELVLAQAKTKLEFVRKFRLLGDEIPETVEVALWVMEELAKREIEFFDASAHRNRKLAIDCLQLQVDFWKKALAEG